MVYANFKVNKIILYEIEVFDIYLSCRQKNLKSYLLLTRIFWKE